MSRERRKVGQGQNFREILEGKGPPKSLRMMRERLKENRSNVVALKPGEQKHRGRRDQILSNVCSILYHMTLRKEASSATA